MTCKEAENLVMPYIRHELDVGQMEEFLEHIDTCQECREELEIYYTVFLGLRQLESGTGMYDVAGALEESLDRLPGLEGAKFVCSPPLRSREDRRAL